ncbi:MULTISPECIES: TetR/AcrR family transcriptional regulator [unclassified Clostridioides]|uniref:TetR/AcrR family transcriptional regulator n=1 Tax=unclassified Clostridioides TaxID=2635829 RepID=UPI0006BBF9D9|nr:transcriptional regulator [Clostridioides difficile]MCC0693266.1 TetR/AcrR family transcriptional regulator [Clostridioides sp. ZZV14-6387]KPI51924.1 transcriptional regulator [Clostridioides difficile]MDB3085468.1 TetR/AcrR family transcriptional regulator [Clostridioides difficile]MDI0264762.1 TetR/AcrR family transcriptional regulator [Clostridioides difficile]
MPPKAKITKKMILNIVLEITRETGFETVNARSIANKLQCSTRPIFTCYENMDELKNEFLAFAYEYYKQYVTNYSNSVNVSPYLILPLSYIEFAQEEIHLFKLLFINDMDLNMTEAKDFYNEIDNEKRARDFSEIIGIELERAKVIFLDLFLYTHGIAVLVATKKLTLDRNSAEKMVRKILSAFIIQEKPDWNLSI